MYYYDKIFVLFCLLLPDGIFFLFVVARRHQAITWTNVNLSGVMSFGIHLEVISQEMLKISILDMSWKLLI